MGQSMYGVVVKVILMGCTCYSDGDMYYNILYG